MKTQSIRIRRGIAAALFSLAAAGTAAAEPSGGVAAPDNIRMGTEAAEERANPLTCQRRNFDDHRAVCCAYKRGGRAWYRQHSRKQCRDLKGAEVARAKCPARHGRNADPAKGLVCCRRTRDRLVYQNRSHQLIPREKCQPSPFHYAAIVDMKHCTRKKTQVERMRECREKGWVWKNNRCQRAAARDRRAVCCSYLKRVSVSREVRIAERMPEEKCRKLRRSKIVAARQCAR